VILALYVCMLYNNEVMYRFTDGPLLPLEGIIEHLEEEIIMSDIIKKLEQEQLKAEVPTFAVGDTVKVYAKIKEGTRERVQVFEGTVLKKQNGDGIRATFTVRKNSNGIGVEKTWPLHSPNVERVEVIRRGKVRRAKLNYLRDRVGKKAKVKERIVR